MEAGIAAKMCLKEKVELFLDFDPLDFHTTDGHDAGGHFPKFIFDKGQFIILAVHIRFEFQL